MSHQWCVCGEYETIGIELHLFIYLQQTIVVESAIQTLRVHEIKRFIDEKTFNFEKNFFSEIGKISIKL